MELDCVNYDCVAVPKVTIQRSQITKLILDITIEVTISTTAPEKSSLMIEEEQPLILTKECKC